MWAMIVKEFRQLRRDRRTLAMMIVLPVLLLVVFGYAASFDVTTIPTVVAAAGSPPTRPCARRSRPSSGPPRRVPRGRGRPAARRPRRRGRGDGRQGP